MSRVEAIRFLHAFVQHPAEIGAIAPSSARLAKAITADLEIPPDRCVIEFGPGTGRFTRRLERHMADPSRYLGIECHPDFVQMLTEKFPEMTFVHGSAEHAVQFHAQAGLPPVHAVISGLPFASLGADVQDRIVEAIDTLLPAGGVFRTFQYLHAYAAPNAVRFRRRMRGLFGPPTATHIVWRNLPPAAVVCWQRPPAPGTTPEATPAPGSNPRN